MLHRQPTIDELREAFLAESAREMTPLQHFERMVRMGLIGIARGNSPHATAARGSLTRTLIRYRRLLPINRTAIIDATAPGSRCAERRFKHAP